jgi:hypothetical protein
MDYEIFFTFCNATREFFPDDDAWCWHVTIGDGRHVVTVRGGRMVEYDLVLDAAIDALRLQLQAAA